MARESYEVGEIVRVTLMTQGIVGKLARLLSRASHYEECETFHLEWIDLPPDEFGRNTFHQSWFSKLSPLEHLALQAED